MKITFLNVGQGDSIILEWSCENEKRLSIIDCNKYGNENPVINYLIQKKITAIEHLIMSHPHFDHYSGMTELLDHCLSNKIKIKFFLHTCMQVPEYLKSAVLTNQAKSELHKLFKKLKELNSNNTIQVAPISGGSAFDTIDLNPTIKLQILSPTTIEFDNYARQTPTAKEEDANNNPNANWLSVIIGIYTEEWLILLTSDSEKYSHIRLGTHQNDLINLPLILGQSAHHGSEKNHNNAFWKKRIRKKATPIVFSVGPNHYNHPSETCVDFFTKEFYSIYSTNNIGALNNIQNSTQAVETALDLFSHKTSTRLNQLEGNKTFIINNNLAHIKY